jgi:hypothetical protein
MEVDSFAALAQLPYSPSTTGEANRLLWLQATSTVGVW